MADYFDYCGIILSESDKIGLSSLLDWSTITAKVLNL